MCSKNENQTAVLATNQSWRQALVLRWVCLLVLGCLAGCSWARRSVVPESVFQCRQLSTQGCAAIEAGNLEDGEQLLRQALAANDSDVEAHRQLAEVLWQRRAQGEAVRHIQQAAHFAPSDATLAVRAGEMSLAMGDNHRTKYWARRAIEADPRLAAAWALRGRALFAEGKTELALADMHRALSYAPGESDVLQSIILVHEKLGQHERCLTTIHQQLDMFAPGEEPQDLLFIEGRTLAKLNRYEDAADRFLAASERGEPRADILTALAQVQQSSGQVVQAKATLQQALAVNAKHSPAVAMLAQLQSSAPSQDETQRY